MPSGALLVSREALEKQKSAQGRSFVHGARVVWAFVAHACFVLFQRRTKNTLSGPGVRIEKDDAPPPQKKKNKKKERCVEKNDAPPPKKKTEKEKKINKCVCVSFGSLHIYPYRPAHLGHGQLISSQKDMNREVLVTATAFGAVSVTAQMANLGFGHLAVGQNQWYHFG